MKNRIAKILLYVILIVFAFSPIAYADFGPKSTLNIIVKSPPSEDYYLDLLVAIADYPNVKAPPHVPELSNDMIKALYRYADEGWYPALHGRITRLGGALAGEPAGGAMKHFFFMAPKEFKIIIATQSGEVLVSDLIITKKFFSEVVYNTRTGRANENASSGFAQYPLTLMVTLIIEGLLLLIFGFKLRDNWKGFLLVNAGTQLFLYISLIYISLAYHMLLVLLAQPLIEIAIIVIECVVYAKILKGQNKGRIKGYAITANLASWFFGGLLLSLLLSLFNRAFI